MEIWAEKTEEDRCSFFLLISFRRSDTVRSLPDSDDEEGEEDETGGVGVRSASHPEEEEVGEISYSLPRRRLRIFGAIFLSSRPFAALTLSGPFQLDW
jgi:hypothetical protein